MRAFIDQDTCMGCGLFAGTAPDVFRMTDNGTAEAYADTAEANKDDVQAAIDGCPVSAIREEE